MVARHAPSLAPERQVDASMTLLNELQRRPLDPGYAEAARRRALTGKGHGTVARVVSVVLAAGLGIGVAAAALSLRRPTADDRQARQLLEDEVSERKDAVEGLEAANAQTAAQIAALQEAALQGEDPQLLESTRRWAVASGLGTVTGPGLRVVLTDAEAAADEDPEDLDLRVQDVDLQVLVNGLWAAGAEAIAVNGQRVGATTAIRSAGSAVLVDLVPLVGPYTVDAIGDAGAMQADLARSSAGQHVAMLHATYGIGLEMTSQRELRLPPSPVTGLGSAVVPDDALLTAGLMDAPAKAVVPESGPDDEGGDGP
jgi:uncharacterized protein YlxW (UPF0749 family)